LRDDGQKPDQTRLDPGGHRGGAPFNLDEHRWAEFEQRAHVAREVWIDVAQRHKRTMFAPNGDPCPVPEINGGKLHAGFLSNVSIEDLARTRFVPRRFIGWRAELRRQRIVPVSRHVDVRLPFDRPVILISTFLDSHMGCLTHLACMF
jgi:hypothetical protein